MARALDSWWAGLGQPDPFVVVEAGAGTGSLAASIVGAEPECAGALRYVLVERSARLRADQPARLPIADPAQVLGPTAGAAAGSGDDDEDEPQTVPGSGPLITALAELPAGPLTGVVLANEVLDNQPFLLLEYRDRRWCDVRVGLRDGPRDELVEVVVPAAPDLAAEAERLVVAPRPGDRLPLQRAATGWLRDALGLLGRGRVVVIDYASTSATLAGRPWTEWLRTYRAHQRGGPPLDAPGAQDITCELAADQLARVRPLAADRSQAEFLRAYGIDELAGAARDAWQARAHIGDLDALRHRSRLSEAAALTDPSGLGAFRVLEWTVAP